jgi:hypothetical protein
MSGENRFINKNGLYIKLSLLPKLIKENKIILSKSFLYKSQQGSGGMYPFLYNDDTLGEKPIYVFIESDSCMLGGPYNSCSLTFKNEDELNVFSSFIDHLFKLANKNKLECKFSPIKTKNEFTSVKCKYYVKEGKISAKLYDLSNEGQPITTLEKYGKYEGRFVVRITGIYKGSLGNNIVIHLEEGWINPVEYGESIVSRFIGKNLKDVSTQKNEKIIINKDKKVNDKDDDDDDNLPF